jgi:hypothetical protein
MGSTGARRVAAASVEKQTPLATRLIALAGQAENLRAMILAKSKAGQPTLNERLLCRQLLALNTKDGRAAVGELAQGSVDSHTRNALCAYYLAISRAAEAYLALNSEPHPGTGTGDEVALLMKEKSQTGAEQPEVLKTSLRRLRHAHHAARNRAR